MYSSVELSSYAYSSVLSHLVDTEERKNEIINELYCDSSNLRDDFSSFLDNYLIKLEELVKTVQIIDKPTREKLKEINNLPYVIIGSTVELEGDNNLGTHVFKIVSPYDNSNSDKDLSYVSALGRALMLKKPGDVVKVKNKNSICSYKIKAIRYEC
jgi:transcription elongation factor GreA